MPPTAEPAVATALSSFQTATSTVTNTPTITNTPVPTLTPTSTITFTPSLTGTVTLTPTPTPNITALTAQLDAAWGKDWPSATAALEGLHQAVPDSREYSDKLSVAYFNYGKALLTKGDKIGAGDQFSKAIAANRNNQDAWLSLSALTPTMTPAPTSTPIPPTPTPTTGPWVSSQVESGGQAMVASDLRFRDSIGYTKADSGYELVLVGVDILNTSSLDLRKSYNQFSDFKLQDGYGNIRRPVIVLGQGQQLGSGELASGGRASGWVIFEIRKGDRRLTLLYHPCILFCEEQKIQLQETYRLN